MRKTYSPRDILPLEIGRYLQDTTHLDATKSGAYLHLLMHYWLHGPLPDDDECLAAVARVSEDTWRIAKNTVMDFFQLGQDGRWHQGGTDRRRDEAMAKHKKRHEASVKANQIRWARYRDLQRGENLGESSDTNRIQSDKSASPSRFPFQVFPHTPFPNTLPTPPQKQPHGDTGRAYAINVGLGQAHGLELVPSWPVVQAHFQLKQNKGENAINAPGRAAVFMKVESIHASSNGSKKAVKNGGNRHPKKDLNPTSADFRFEIFRQEIFRFWAGQNPGAESPPWTHLESIALTSFLELYPTTDLEGFKELLRNRAASDTNPRSRPAKWIRDLGEFAAGPLDRYQQLKRPARRL